MVCKALLSALLLAASFAPLPGLAQDSSVTADIIIEGLSNANGAKRTSDVIDAIRESLESPESHSKILNTYLQSDHGWQFLKDINFQFKVFDADSTSDAGLGFSYDYQKSITDRELRCNSQNSRCVRGLDLSFSAKGNVAFDHERNPKDFLESALSFGFFQSNGGISQLTEEVRPQILALDEEFALASTDEEEEAALQKIITTIRPYLSNQIYWEIAGDFSLEANQRFTMKQWTYGIHAIFDIKAWSNESALAQFNIFDYPFAFLRALTGYDDCSDGFSGCFTPRGTTWPTFLVGVARIQPQDNDPRAQAGDGSDFDRIRIEASFRTPVARIRDDGIYISVNYRYYSELNALQIIKDADLDSFDFFTIVLGGSDGVYVSYSDGMLPLDFADDQVYELGYQFHF